ncbi:MAG: hypothetical protein ACRDXD_13295 [Acidimicrobiia bacterium]
MTTPSPLSLTPRQKQILIGLGIGLGVVLLALLIVGLGRESPPSPITTALGTSTTTSTTRPITTTTTTSTTTTSIPDTTTTSEATTTTASTTTTTALTAELFTLRGDGLDVVDFGDPPELVIAALTAAFGSPDEDSGWIGAATSPYGVCPGEQVRGVRWRDLLVLFSDGDTPYGTADPMGHFFSYVDSIFFDQQDLLGLETEEEIGLGSTRAELEEAYGDRVTITEDEVFGVFFEIEVPDPAVLWGHLEDASSGAPITDIRGGSGCGE